MLPCRDIAAVKLVKSAVLPTFLAGLGSTMHSLMLPVPGEMYLIFVIF